MIEQKLSELSETIKLQNGGDHESALGLIDSDRGQKLMDEIRLVAGQLEAYERQRLGTFAAEVRTGRNRLIAAIATCFIVIFGMLSKVYRLVKTEMKDRRRNEEVQARLVALLEASSDFVGIAEVSGRVLYVSGAGRRMVGKSESSIPRTVIPDYFPDSALKIVMTEGIPTAIREGKWSGENAMLRADGGEVPVSQVILSHRDSSGRVQYLSTIARDITERRRAEEAIRRSQDELEQRVKDRTGELELANIALRDEVTKKWEAVDEATRACEAAETASRAKSEFLANMSHEIRTPMNGVLGMLDLVIRSGLPRRQHEFLALAKSSAETLLRLLADGRRASPARHFGPLRR